MANKKKNQPPTGEGKKQNPFPGEENKLSKRSEVLQAQRNHPEENILANEEEAAYTPSADQQKKAARQKAGR